MELNDKLKPADLKNLDHNNIINSNNIIIEDNKKVDIEKRNFNILLSVLIIIVILFIISYLNGSSVLSK